MINYMVNPIRNCCHLSWGINPSASLVTYRQKPKPFIVLWRLCSLSSQNAVGRTYSLLITPDYFQFLKGKDLCSCSCLVPPPSPPTGWPAPPQSGRLSWVLPLMGGPLFPPLEILYPDLYCHLGPTVLPLFPSLLFYTISSVKNGVYHSPFHPLAYNQHSTTCADEWNRQVPKDLLAGYWPSYLSSEWTRKQWTWTHLAPSVLPRPVSPLYGMFLWWKVTAYNNPAAEFQFCYWQKWSWISHALYLNSVPSVWHGRKTTVLGAMV